MHASSLHAQRKGALQSPPVSTKVIVIAPPHCLLCISRIICRTPPASLTKLYKAVRWGARGRLDVNEPDLAKLQVVRWKEARCGAWVPACMQPDPSPCIMSMLPGMKACTLGVLRPERVKGCRGQHVVCQNQGILLPWEVPGPRGHVPSKHAVIQLDVCVGTLHFLPKRAPRPRTL
eukprot:1138457-Pelagomonas_calceolata.AAC.5